jgi:ribosomal-protein-serine acetyltransferase
MFPLRINDHATLELLDEGHVDELFCATDANRAHLRAWLPWVDATRTPDDTRAFVRQALKDVAENSTLVAVIRSRGAVIRSRGAVVGVIGHHRINWNNRSTSLGYWLAADAQGRGIMTAACRAFTAHAFETLGLNRVEIRCAVGNRRSRAIPERLGFTAEGTLREAEWLYDHFVDHVLYRMLASEWREGFVART